MGVDYLIQSVAAATYGRNKAKRNFSIYAISSRIKGIEKKKKYWQHEKQ